MLAMSEVNCIKTLRNEKGLSITEIANTMQVTEPTTTQDFMKSFIKSLPTDCTDLKCL